MNHVAVFSFVAASLILLGACRVANETHNDEAITVLEHAVELAPGNSDAYMYLADAYRAAGRIDDAIELFATRVENSPREYWPHLGLGRLYVETGRTDEAIVEFNLAISKAPTRRGAYSALSRLYLKIDESPIRGVSLLQAAIEANPNENWPGLLLAALYRQAGDLEAALRAAEGALLIATDSAAKSRTHLELGRIQELRMDTAEALEHYEVARDLNPDSITALIKIGDLQFQQQRFEAASEAYEASRQLTEARGVYLRLGEAYMHLKRQDDARAVYLEGVERWPQDLQFRFRLGRLQEMQGLKDEAIASYQLIIEQDTANRDAVVSLAELYWKENRFDEAIALYESASRADPKAVWPTLEMGKLHLELAVIEQRNREAGEPIE